MTGARFERGGRLVARVKSDRSGSMYEVFGHPDGAFRCTCMAWKFQRDKTKERSCKHTEAFAMAVELSDDGVSSDNPNVEFVMT